MGANNSTEFDDYGPRMKSQGHVSYLPQGKPSVPEGIPKVTGITHNSVTLSWLSPMNSGKILAYQVESCNVKERKWRIVTSTCQGTCYHIRNLIPETHYVFRVRAENLCGQSKPSRISEIIQTRSVATNPIEEKSATKLVRRHSHCIRLDGGVNTLLKRTDETDSVSDIGSLPFKRNSLRGSLPASLRARKNSVRTILPGAQRESVCTLTESKNYVEDSSLTEEDSVNLKRISTSSTEGSSIFSSNSVPSIPEDEEFKTLYTGTDFNVCCDNDDSFSTTNSHVSYFSSASSQCSSFSQGSQSSHGSHGVSCRVTNSPFSQLNKTNSVQKSSNYMTASIPDDTKIEYFSQPQNGLENHPKKCFSKGSAGKTIFEVCDNEIWKGRIDRGNEDISKNRDQNSANSSSKTTTDLRAIRQMLNSQDVMVKTMDNVESSRLIHCAIQELDEEHVPMDIVSTI